MNLADGILIKDNHIAALRRSGLSLGQIISRAKENNKSGLKIEVEVNSMAEAVEAAGAGADMLLLDNMSMADMKETVVRLQGQGAFRGFGRHHAGKRARRGRNRRGCHLHRRADALGKGARLQPGDGLDFLV